jgi:hypothetical protein
MAAATLTALAKHIEDEGNKPPWTSN